MIAIWWIGEAAGEEALFGEVSRRIAGEFGVPAAMHRSRERPTDTYDERRKQHLSRSVLRWLLAASPSDAARVIAITDVDLFMPVLTFVFGEAQLGGRAAVVSTARLVDAVSPARTTARVVKECVHELGHTFGLLHCSSPACVMRRSTSVEAVDRKRPHLCGECRAALRAAQQDGLHV